jgi:uncharacterized membrane protein
MLYLLSSIFPYYFTNLIYDILIVVLFVKLFRVNKKIREVSSELDTLKKQRVDYTGEKVTPNQYSETTQVKQQDGYILNNTQGELRTPVALATEAPNPLANWFKENPLLKIGILMILIGFGWFVSYAFAHNWIGPVGRITVGILLGTIITVFGTFRLGKNQLQGNSLTILGTALVVITLLAGQYYYAFFGPYVTLIIIFVVSLYTSLTAVAYSSEKLAVYGMVVSLLAPLLSHSAGMDPVILYFYLAVISVAGIWISVVRNWGTIMVVGITGIFLYSIASAFGSHRTFEASKYIILALVYVIAMLYLWVGVWSLIQNKIKATANDVYLAIVNTAILLGVTINIVPKTYQSLVIAGWMLAYALSGFLVFQKTRNEKLFYIHALISVLLLGIATSIELQGQSLVIAFIIEAALIILASFVVTGKIKTAENFSVLMLIPAFMSLQSISTAKWYDSVLHSDFAVLLLMVVVLAGLGIFYKMNRNQESHGLKLANVFLITSSIYAFAIIWLATHSGTGNYGISITIYPAPHGSYDAATFISLLIYTIVGLTCHFYGLFKGSSVLKKYGMTILILVVARLVLVDVWRMELVLRVITFIVLGIMFMSTAFISKSRKSTEILTQKQI